MPQQSKQSNRVLEFPGRCSLCGAHAQTYQHNLCRSCLMPMMKAAGQAIHTVERLRKPAGKLVPLHKPANEA